MRFSTATSTTSKDVNDIHGHQTGDDVLVAVAEGCGQPFAGRTLMARLGGDEFVIILRDVDGMEDCERVAALIHQAMRLPIHGEHADLTAEFTIGVCPGVDTDRRLPSLARMKRSTPRSGTRAERRASLTCVMGFHHQEPPPPPHRHRRHFLPAGTGG